MMKHYIAIFIAFILLLSSVIYLVGLVNALNRKIDGLQREPAQVGNNCLTVIVITEQETEPIVLTEPTLPEHDIGTEPTTPDINTEPTLLEPDIKPEPTNYYGRLCIPEANIDVGLYYGADQAITDRQDSANIFTMSVFDGLYIADHNNQEFANLYAIVVGMRGYLTLANGEVLNIVCTDVFNGHHTGKHIVDENGNTNLDGDYLMYTCRDSWQNILICLWKHG